MPHYVLRFTFLTRTLHNNRRRLTWKIGKVRKVIVAGQRLYAMMCVHAVTSIVSLRRTKMITKDEQILALQMELTELEAALHYPECWDTMTYPTFLDALLEIGCSSEHEG